MWGASGTTSPAGTTGQKQAEHWGTKPTETASHRQARPPPVKGLNLVLPAIIILAWEISSVSRITHSEVLENPHSLVPSLHARAAQEQMKGAWMQGLIPTQWLPSEQERPGHCTGLGSNHGNSGELKTASL